MFIFLNLARDNTAIAIDIKDVKSFLAEEVAAYPATVINLYSEDEPWYVKQTFYQVEQQLTEALKRYAKYSTGTTKF